MARRVKRRGKTRRELLAREDEFRRLREERAKLVEVNGAEPPRVPALPPPARPGAPHAGEPRPEPDGRALTERRPKPHASAGRRAAAAAANKLPRVKAALALAGGASPGGGLGSPERWRKTVSPTVRAPRNGDPFSNLAPGGHFPAPGGGKPTTFEAALAPALLGPLGSKRPLERAPSLKKPAPPPPRAAAAPREKTPQLAAPLVVAAVPRGLPDEYRLCWQDVFDYEGVPHPSRWEYQCDANDWIHDERHCEAQWYTDKLDNACVRDGRLRIIARLERSHGCRYTSARLRTKHRATGSTAASSPSSCRRRTGGFHTYAMNWTPKALEIFVDNGLALRVEDKGRGPGDWPYSKRFHLLLNLAIGGWGGQYGIDDTAFPACLEVDSVRVFQRSWRESEPEQ
ncbi:glycosyl hydrolase [Aureococcus anophagefferens]|nr:glycosyl hydrolase [Aureococcus anophagefferens]